MTNMKTFRVLSALLVVGLFGACASNTGVKIDNSWVNGDYRGGPLGKILVVGLGQNPENVKFWEDTFVTSLTKAGYDITPAYTVFTDPISTEPQPTDLEAAKQKIHDMGFGGIIIGKIRDVESGPVVEGGEYHQVATPAYYSWYSYYQPQVYTIQDATRVVNIDRVRIETNIYAVQGEELVYTAMIDSINMSNLNQAIKGLVNSVMKDLKKRNLLK